MTPPLAILAELTQRCPLRCPYCSNPVELTRGSAELTTEEWAASSPKPPRSAACRRTCPAGSRRRGATSSPLSPAAHEAGLYTNLITAGVLLDAALMARLVAAGLDHVQLSVQDAEPASAERYWRHEGCACAQGSRGARGAGGGAAVTLNAVVHRQNLLNLPLLIDTALAWGAARLEVAHVQYYGWALINRDALLPTREQLDEATRIVAAARDAHRGRLVIDYVRARLPCGAAEGLHGRLGQPLPRSVAGRPRSARATPPNPSPA